jgi:hypothetical protein
MRDPQEILDAITDVVLRYRPPKKRKKRKKIKMSKKWARRTIKERRGVAS